MQSQERKRERRLRRALGMLSASPEVSTQQSSQSCANVFSLPTLWSPGPAVPPLLVLGSALPGRDCGVVGVLSWRWVLSAVLKNLTRHYAPRHVHKSAGPELQAKCAHGHALSEGICLPFHGQSPTCPAVLCASQDATDWIDTEDCPFLWFFCLF